MAQHEHQLPHLDIMLVLTKRSSLHFQDGLMAVTHNSVLEAASQRGVRYPFEYFAAPLTFANRISGVTGARFWDCVSKYTPVHEEVTGTLFQEKPNEVVWNTIIHSTAGKSYQEIAQFVYALYLEQPHAAFDANWVPQGSTRFGALGVDTGPYNLSRNQVKLHFLPTRARASDLASSRLQERREDIKKLLIFVKATHPGVHYFTSYTWLQNIPTYRALFPPSFLERLVVMRDKFLGVWGQFVKWDGTPNQTNYNEFMGRLQQATTLDDIIDSIPLKVLGATRPIREFYDFYGIH
jgi:hypothetical protein